jgi:predicted sugar kinase
MMMKLLRRYFFKPSAILSLPEDLAVRAHLADGILKNPAFDDAFKQVEKNIVESFKSVPVEDIQNLQRLRISLSVLAAVRGQIEGHIKAASMKAWEDAQPE